MENSRKLRIMLVTAAVIAIVFSGIYVADYQAKPLFDKDITLMVKGEPEFYSEVGEEITYTYTLTIHIDDPDVSSLSNIGVSDDLTSVSCPISTLENGNEMICTSVYTITEDDIIRGEVTNKASVYAQYEIPSYGGCGSSNQDIVYPSTEASYTVRLLPQPELSLKKTGTPNIFTEAGQEIKYTYLVSSQ
ncbi:MAG: hypothetical protein HN560_05135 [Anaerolineae bacterium]|jgi:hypothetical protein|nr:hypothetical protein [Anaerolineae bacterium]